MAAPVSAPAGRTSLIGLLSLALVAGAGFVAAPDAMAKAEEEVAVTADEATPEAVAEIAARKTAREEELAALTRDMEISGDRQETIAREIAELDQDRASLNAALIRTAERVHRLETALAESEERYERLGGNEDEVRLSLSKRRAVLAEVLAALERIGQKPPPALAVRPEDALAAVRSAILLGGVLPELRLEAEALAGDLAELTALKRQMAAERDRLAGDARRLAEERARLGVLLADKKARFRARNEALAAEKKKAEELAAKATSLKDLVAGLEKEIASAREAAEAAARAAREREEKGEEAVADASANRLAPAVAFIKTKGHLSLPARGAVLRRYGDDDGIGGESMGVSVSTRPRARIVAPVDGWVVYGGPFRSYGQLLILNAGDGYHILLAGMETIDVELGQFVLAGEPIAVMGTQRLASAATLDIGSTQPVLYIEFRKDGKAIDSAPWWVDMENQKVDG
ncbi:septal ring factor EnvC (AmiA/AmiB activator) [Rhodobium orientis]|nr:peptidoglycan DD-metalloendopeptidase family protein [Rhodobium orientis]MBB4303559.1 septal ring factor EnvC (AmiA/AmiB activator) [Rhodobium orientis]